MTTWPSARQLLCAFLLILVTMTAGCPNPWQSTSYSVYGKVVSEPRNNTTVISYTNETIRSSETIQAVVEGAIATYEARDFEKQNNSTTPQPTYHDNTYVERSEYKQINKMIARNPSTTVTIVPREDVTHTAIFVGKDGYVVQVWTGKEIAL